VSVTADDDSRVEKVDLWVDGQLRSIDLTAPYSFALDTRTLANGSHRIEARAYDIDGRRASTSRTVTVAN
jgi:bacterial leucyl aminopeptidase